MKVKQYLRIGRHGIMAVTKSRPDLRAGEISMLINLEVPDTLFEQPNLSAKIRVDENAITSNKNILDIVLDVKEAIQQQAGVKLDFEINQENTNNE
jgi:hypothetical protein